MEKVRGHMETLDDGRQTIGRQNRPARALQAQLGGVGPGFCWDHLRMAWLVI